MKDISINGQAHETATYRAAPHEILKVIIRNVPLSETQDLLTRKIVNPRNPLALAAKRIKETNMVIIAFDGFRVPNYVRYDNALVKWTLYRKQVDMCYVCGRLGHRADMCPSPDETICRGCGIPHPAHTHHSTPKYSQCGQGHLTASTESRQRFQLPYVVRRRTI
ncbi:hypothetical protein HPB49_008373 [Dermacentor silvarum]|uniref:Uncharacterized protein n=1 Tax=Dermacentor silvarum TaxID=543639 RepID=A0ACB8C2Q3_DERSI|nr:hypothetical protein HPB49_008373 [Dermacentor silvarum]